MKTKLLLCAALLSGGAHAGFWDGNELLNRLNSEETPRRLTALGYIMGVHDTMENINHCTNSNVTAGQLRDIVRNYLTNVPAERHYSADSIVLKSLEIAFPCANRPRGGKQL